MSCPISSSVNKINDFNFMGEEVKEIESLSPELIAEIILRLPKEDRVHASKVNRRWNRISLEMEQLKFKQLEEFLVILIENIPVEYKKEREDILKIIEDTKIPDIFALRKLSYKSLIKKLISIIQKFEFTDIEKLGTLSNNSVSNKMLRIAGLHQKINYAYTISRESLKNKELVGICTSLMDFGYMDWAVDIAFTISNDGHKCEVLKNICVKISNNDDIKKALEIARSIHEGFVIAYCLRNICEVLINKGRLEEALEIAYTIPTQETVASMDMTFNKLCSAFASTGKIFRLVEIASDLTQNQDKVPQLCRHFILKNFFENKLIDKDKVIELVNNIPDQYQKYRMIAWLNSFQY